MKSYFYCTHFLLALISFLFLSLSTSAAEKVLVNMMSSNAISSELPLGIFQGKSFTALSDGIYVKLHIFPDTEIAGLTGIRIYSCKKQFMDRIDAFINFDEVHARSESGSGFFVEGDSVKNDATTTKVTIPFSPEQSLTKIRSITLNFNTSVDICISKLELLVGGDLPLVVETPVIVPATVHADSVLSPEDAYDPFQLFDSRFETGWATNKKSTGATLSVDFKNDVKIEAIKIWNGYQRSLNHCQANSRPKKIKLKMDTSEVELTLEDKLGPQELKLPKAMKGKQFKLIALDSFHGSKYEDMVISELRFFDGKNWFMPDPLPQIQALHQKNKAEFAKAGLDFILNHDLSSQFDSDSKSSNLRIRSDGTFFYSGSYVKGDTEFLIDSLGSYEIKKVSKDSIQLRLFGYYKKHLSEMGGDCNGCGFKCNSENPKDKDPKTIFQEEFVLKKAKEAKKVKVESTNKNSKIKMSKDDFTVL